MPGCKYIVDTYVYNYITETGNNTYNYVGTKNVKVRRKSATMSTITARQLEDKLKTGLLCWRLTKVNLPPILEGVEGLRAVGQ